MTNIPGCEITAFNIRSYRDKYSEERQLEEMTASVFLAWWSPLAQPAAAVRRMTEFMCCLRKKKALHLVLKGIKITRRGLSHR